MELLEPSRIAYGHMSFHIMPYHDISLHFCAHSIDEHLEMFPFSSHQVGAHDALELPCRRNCRLVVATGVSTQLNGDVDVPTSSFRVPLNSRKKIYNIYFCLLHRKMEKSFWMRKCQSKESFKMKLCSRAVEELGCRKQGSCVRIHLTGGFATQRYL